MQQFYTCTRLDQTNNSGTELELVSREVRMRNTCYTVNSASKHRPAEHKVSVVLRFRPEANVELMQFLSPEAVSQGGS